MTTSDDDDDADVWLLALYSSHTTEMLVKRYSGDLSEAEEDDYAEQLDRLWQLMGPSARDEARKIGPLLLKAQWLRARARVLRSPGPFDADVCCTASLRDQVEAWMSGKSALNSREREQHPQCAVLENSGGHYPTDDDPLVTGLRRKGFMTAIDGLRAPKQTGCVTWTCVACGEVVQVRDPLGIFDDDKTEA